MRRCLLCVAALGLTLALCLTLMGRDTERETLPGARLPQRRQVRVWTLGAIGGGTSWLKSALRAYEKEFPGAMTYLREASVEELSSPDAPLPDLVIYLPGDVSDPSAFSPLSGEINAEEALLRCGRWEGRQMAAPLCYGGYVAAISETMEQSAVQTPAPTPLLGLPAPTGTINATATPGYPVQAEGRLQIASGPGMLAAAQVLLGARPPLAENLGVPSQAEVYAGLLAGTWPAAVLTTGQAVALEARMRASAGPACRFLVPEEVITDQVWLASVPHGAEGEGGALLAFLLSDKAQKLLSSQGLQPVRRSLRLYAQGVSAQVAASGARGLYAVNAYWPRERVAAACRRVLEGQESWADAIAPLL